MFVSCPNLKTAPQLPATKLAEYCYNGMFSGCTALTKADELPATTLEIDCYSRMFRDCISLTSSPLLPAPKLVDFCYESMFYGCSSLCEVICLITDFNDSWWGLYDWLTGVSSTGTFIMADGMESQWPVGGEFGFPAGWNIEKYDREIGIHSINVQPVSGQYFDMSGCCIAKPRHGLYIHNGKKILSYE